MLGSTAPHAGRLADGQCVRRIGFCTNREQDLECCKGDHQDDERVLDRQAAPPARFQMFKA
jgi:hypothetical protein